MTKIDKRHMQAHNVNSGLPRHPSQLVHIERTSAYPYFAVKSCQSFSGPRSRRSYARAASTLSVHRDVGDPTDATLISLALCVRSGKTDVGGRRAYPSTRPLHRRSVRSQYYLRVRRCHTGHCLQLCPLRLWCTIHESCEHPYRSTRLYFCVATRCRLETPTRVAC